MKQLAQWLIAERLVVAVILLNTAALFVMGMTEPGLAGAGSLAAVPHQTWFEAASWVDYGCAVFFLVELAIKCRLLGRAEFWASGWNRFDLIVVAVSAPVLLSPWLDMHSLGVFLALRLGRLFRLFRMMRFIPDRAHLYLGIKRALQASVGVLLALVVVNLVLALGATQLFGQAAPEHFGDPIISSYSLFRIFTVEGWNELPDLIAARSHPALGTLARLYFSAAVLGGGILGLSLANAVFVDQMTMDNHQTVDDKLDAVIAQLAELRAQLAARLPDDAG